MKNFVLILFVALGLGIGVQDVRAQNTHNADLHPPYLAEEEPDLPEGEEVPALEEGEEGEITERGVRRFRLKPGKRIIIPKRPNAGTEKFRLKRRPLVPPSGDPKTPPRGEEGVPIEPPSTNVPPGSIDPSGTVDSPPFVQDPDIEPPPRPFTEKELIDERIDFHAQRSLLRISKTNRIVDAKLLFKAVKSGTLGGIYKADTQVPALRAVRMGTLWFKLMDQGQNSICLTEPTKPGEKPILVFRKSLVEPQIKMAELDAALLQYRQLCKFAVLTVEVRAGVQPVIDADVDIQNVSLGIDTDNCRTTVSGRCRFALSRGTSYDVIVLHGGQKQVKRVVLPPNETDSQVEFNFESGKGGIPPQPGNLLVTALGHGKQIAGAAVRIIGASENQLAFFGVTGVGGIASFAPPAGEYTVFVTKDGFDFGFQKVKILEGVSTPVIVNLNVIPLR